MCRNTLSRGRLVHREKILHGDRLGTSIPDFTYQLVDLSAIGRAKLDQGETVAHLVLRLGLAILEGEVRDVLPRILDGLVARKRKTEPARLGRILYHVCRASGQPEGAEDILGVLELREVSMTDLSSLFHKFKEECVEEGEQRKEAEDLRELVATILRLFDLKGIPRSSYQKDIEGFQHHRDATRFLEDFTAASDSAQYLKERFGR